jgi:hypothetical protein
MQPPDVTFYRYFQTVPRPRGLDHIKGRQDLDVLPADFRAFLADTQKAVNHSFTLAEAPMAELGRPLVPYLDSREECGHAFESEGYHSIGISIPMVERLRDSAERLLRTEQVVALLSIPAGYVNRRRNTHHQTSLHHCPRIRASLVGSRIGFQVGELEQRRGYRRKRVIGTTGNVADSYAIYLALGSLVDGPQGRQVLEMLGHHSPPDADAILLSALLLSAFSLFSAKSGHSLDAKTVYGLSHPPAFARVNGIIQTTRVWCQQSCPQLNEWLTQERLEAIMSAEESSRPGSEGLWARQIEFFGSADGAEYSSAWANSFPACRRRESRRIDSVDASPSKRRSSRIKRYSEKALPLKGNG